MLAAYPTFISEHDTHFDMFIRHTKYSRPMSSISELKTDGIGGPLQVRIVRKWRHHVRRYETWYLVVDRFVSHLQIQFFNNYVSISTLNIPFKYHIQSLTLYHFSFVKRVMPYRFLVNELTRATSNLFSTFRTAIPSRIIAAPC